VAKRDNRLSFFNRLKQSGKEWWKDHCEQFPRVSLAARKWLSIYSTSTPSERVFSICLIVNSVKGSGMNDDVISAQVFIYNNFDR
jgi:hAT family C-terminal dimerisation region